MLDHTLPGTLRALSAIIILSATTKALQVSPSSPCSSQCTIDGAVNTNTSDIVCSDPDFNSTATGVFFRNCIECLQTSHYFSGTDSDAGWLLYNLRFTVNVCLFRYPGADPKNETLACNVDYVCKPLQSALGTDELATTGGSKFGYCTADNSAFRGQSRTTCIGCLQGSPSNKYLSNFMIALEAGCEQQPVPGKVLGLSGSVFSEGAINITGQAGASATGTGQNGSKAHLSAGAIAGIAVGAAVLLLIGAALMLLYYCRQRRYNKEDRARRASYASYLGYPTYPVYPGENGEIALQGPSYTMDYKSPTQNTTVTDGGSESSYNRGNGAPQGQPSVHSRQLSTEELQKSPSAMPIHPAYVPRAVMRRNSPATVAQSQFSSAQPSRTPSFDSPPSIALSAPSQRRPSRGPAADGGSIQASSHSANNSIGSTTSFSQRRERQQVPVPLNLDDPSLGTDIHHTAIRQLEQHGIYAADQQRNLQQQQQQQLQLQQQPSPPYQQVQPQATHQPSQNHQPVPSFAAGPGPAMTSHARASSTSSSKSSPSNPSIIQQPVPIHTTSRSSRNNGGRPIPLTLSGNNTAKSTTPRSLQQKTPPFQQQNLTPPFQTKRSDAPLPGLQDIEISGPLAFPSEEHRFREREHETRGGVLGHGTVGPGAARFAGNSSRFADRDFIRKGWVAEVPLDSERDDLW